MGTTFNQPANLTLFQDFFIGNGGMYVEENGNLFINTPVSAMVTGVVNVDGALYFTNGGLSGQFTVSKKGSAQLSGPGEKLFSACNFVSQGPITLGGTFTLNESSVITISGAATAQGSLNLIQTDSSSNLFDVSSGTLSYSGPGLPGLQVQLAANFGALSLNNGNMTIFSTVQFESSVYVPKDFTITAVGTAVVNMSNGVTGAGMISASGSSMILGGLNFTGFLNVVGGNLTFASKTSSVGVFSIAGGTTFLTSEINAAQLNLLNGIVTGTSTLRAQKTYIKTKGFVLDGSVHFIESAYIASRALLTFTRNGNLWARHENILYIPSGASLSLTGSSNAAGFTNDGIVSMSGKFSTQNINVAGSGSFNVSAALQISSVTFTTNRVRLSTGGSFKGANSNLAVAAVTGSPAVAATFGSYTVQCVMSCNAVDTTHTPTSNFAFSIAS
jgi:hypothetical protein